jgi:hypothetical protein
VIGASTAALVTVWERAGGLPPGERGRALLALDPGSAGDVEGWTLGRLDTACAQIFGALFGDALEATVRCGACDALLEFETTIGALFGADAARAAEPGPFCIRHAGYELTLAPLRVGDLIALPPSPGQAVESVLRRCVLDARRDAGAVDLATLPAGVRAAVSHALAHADPRADILVALACDCGVDNTVVFDIGTFLWEALDRCVVQTLADVHALASAYGWAERDILALPEQRRRRYLGFVAG